MPTANCRKLLWISVLILSCATVAQADDGPDGPFGLTMGQSFASLPITKDMGNALYAVDPIPNPHPLLAKYTVFATHEDGVCSVTGYSPATKDRLESRRTFETLRSQLDERYGRGEYSRPSRGLHDGKRYLDRQFWGVKNDQVWEGKLRAIYLTLYMEGRDMAVMAAFDFQNKDECKIDKGTDNPF